MNKQQAEELIEELMEVLADEDADAINRVMMAHSMIEEAINGDIE